ncbi:hypothetical protein KDA_70080 [Dictyobacter alpinus]|uniref:Nudix hydrolase domain-containing protein n=1 Tax=Dictyobacter alpinus TaxID=2014873 RepID=A0A402BJJ9_9CHLR|nr:NUDIX hydrolase [Dictyobacter alpinus]GCE31524.1 hypothetical protein KDA_70080 [Dictyobacter alpinus]
MGLGHTARVIVTVDVFVLRQTSRGLQVLLIQRGKEPYAGQWALPGGKLDEHDLTLEDAACREVHEETGIVLDSLVQVATFGNVDRDPRGRYVSVLYAASVPPESVMYTHAGDDAMNAAWFPFDTWPTPLAFDHDALVALAMSRL